MEIVANAHRLQTLRPNDVLRTITRDGNCIIRTATSLEGRSLLELALADYEYGCQQEVIDTRGPGFFYHVDTDENGYRHHILPDVFVNDVEILGHDIAKCKLFLVSYKKYSDTPNVSMVMNGRQDEIFMDILSSPHYRFASVEDYLSLQSDEFGNKIKGLL